MAWFKDWFNSPYYHLLYGKRDEKEAEMLMRHLVSYLNPVKGSRMLDLACGKGRHAIILNEMGFDVTGLDLSENSIREASQHASDSLHFAVHDMRKPFRENGFDYVFNLFTSFGYFKEENDNLMTLKAVHSDLVAGGVFVHDYFNAELIPDHYTYNEVKSIGGIDFHIRKHIEDRRIIKHISFTDKGKNYGFKEKVSLFRLDDFRLMYRQAGFEIQAVFGDYGLSPFDPSRSERLILISKKI